MLEKSAEEKAEFRLPRSSAVNARKKRSVEEKAEVRLAEFRSQR